jgi:hypothetical protein
MSVDSLSKLLKLHLESDKNTIYSKELEIKFGTLDFKNIQIEGINQSQIKDNFKKISKIDTINVIEKLKSCGYEQRPDESQNHSLRIFTQFASKEGRYVYDNERIEIEGIYGIQKFCKDNKLDYDHRHYVPINLIKKYPVKITKNVNIPEYKCRATYSVEYKLKRDRLEEKKNTFHETKKTFRLLNRNTFRNPLYPFRIDISTVKQAMKPVLTISESNIFNAPENYEIELELLTKEALIFIENTEDGLKKLEHAIKSQITVILSGLQESNYPIKMSEQIKVKSEYLTLIESADTTTTSKNFIGPSSVALKLQNIQKSTKDIDHVPNIRNPGGYAATDKADGDRKMMFINSEGKCYLFNTLMKNPQYTGLQVSDKNVFNSVLDGEHILHDKSETPKFINLYAVFDVYFKKGKNVMKLPFKHIEKTKKDNPDRFSVMKEIVEVLSRECNKKKGTVSNFSFQTRVKTFHFGIGDSMENANSIILQECKTLEYNTDGIIFTPSSLGVGQDKLGGEVLLKKMPPWEYSMKWKPPEYNTVDFLVKTVKKNGTDLITTKYDINNNDGIFPQVKTLVLHVGFNPSKDGYENPKQQALDGKFIITSSRDMYQPAPFKPTDPSDPNAHLCEIVLKNDVDMFTEEGDAFTDDTIVEFRRELREDGDVWIPLRVRKDKTEEYNNSGKRRQFGNAYRVANSNWQSIYNPINENMLTNFENIPESVEENDDVYYNKKIKTTFTQNMRHFHNFVKAELINTVAKPFDNLIDYAVGKAGDIHKWKNAKIKFVLGIDNHTDNLDGDKVDGAYARYLNLFLKSKEEDVPKCIFLGGDSSLNIRSGAAMFSEKDKKIAQHLFGTHHYEKLGSVVEAHKNEGSSGFKISSCQFALHYFFESKISLANFLINICECTAVNGYFIGTAFDGKRIFNALEDVEVGDYKMIYNNDIVISKIKKSYTSPTFPDDINSLGMQIDVFQETINKEFPEFLVNFDYLTQIMEHFGFALNI